MKQCGFLLGDHAFQSTTCFFLAIGAYTVSTFLADVKFSQIEGNGRKFRHISLSKSVVQNPKIIFTPRYGLIVFRNIPQKWAVAHTFLSATVLVLACCLEL